MTEASLVGMAAKSLSYLKDTSRFSPRLRKLFPYLDLPVVRSAGNLALCSRRPFDLNRDRRHGWHASGGSASAASPQPERGADGRVAAEHRARMGALCAASGGTLGRDAVVCCPKACGGRCGTDHPACHGNATAGGTRAGAGVYSDSPTVTLSSVCCADGIVRATTKPVCGQAMDSIPVSSTAMHQAGATQERILGALASLQADSLHERVVRCVLPFRARADGPEHTHCVPKGVLDGVPDAVAAAAAVRALSIARSEVKWCAVQVDGAGLATLRGPCLWGVGKTADAVAGGAGCVLPLPPPVRRQSSVLICIVSSSSTTDQRRLLKGMRHLHVHGAGAQVDWAIITYDGGAWRWGTTMHLARKHSVRLTVQDGRVPPTMLPPHSRSAGAHLKLHLQRQFVPLAVGYRHVWLPDADISFDGFALGEYMRRLVCAHSGGSPLVSQPIISENTQSENYFVNADQHNASGTAMLPCAVLEQQAPLYDAGFFQWLMPRVGGLVAQQLAMKSSWGLDKVRCGAAFVYARAVLKDNRRLACAIVTVPISHANTKSIEKTPQFLSAGRAINRWIHSDNATRDPTWKSFLDGQAQLVRTLVLGNCLANKGSILYPKNEHQNVGCCPAECGVCGEARYCFENPSRADKIKYR